MSEPVTPREPSTRPSRTSRILPWVMLVGLLVLAYPAYRGLLPQEPAPQAAPEAEMQLTPAEQAELESNLRGVMLRMAMNDAKIEKMFKDGKGYVMVVQSGDMRMTLRMEKEAQPAPAAKPVPKPVR